MQLHLEAHGQAVCDDPVGEFARRDLAWLGENSTSQRSCERVFGEHVARPLVIRARSQMTNFTWSCGVSSGRFSQRLRCDFAASPGVLMSTTRETRGSTSAMSIAPEVSSDTT